MGQIVCIIASLLLVSVKGSDRRTKYGCEGTVLDIQCEEGTVINLVRANYGRFSISICNEKGNTAWSVNCMEPRTLRVINARCGSQPRCTVPVDSDIFGDPCPGTHKYVEVHYTCVPQSFSTTTSKPRPPWLEDLNATPAPVPWRFSSKVTSTEKPVKSTSTSTTTTTTTTTVSTTEKPTTSTQTTSTTTTKRSTTAEAKKEFIPSVSPSHIPYLGDEAIILEAVSNHCPPATVRNMFWNWTMAGNSAIQPCPGGSTGFAKWRCASDANWYSGSPDLSECQSHWLRRLDTRLHNGESVISVSTDLAAVTETRSLYGGDLLMTAQLMQSLAHRLRQDLFSMANQEQKETLVAELMQNIMKTASNLLEDMQELAWSDLRPSERAAAGTNLVLGIEENAFLFADTVNNEKNLVDVTNNILSSVRIMRSRDVANQVFPSIDTRHMLGEAMLEVPSEALIENSVNGAVRLIFFLYDKMDRVLPSSTNGVKFLNSKVVSAAMSKGRHVKLSKPVKVTLRHLQSQDVRNPSCMWWDYVSRTWKEDGCTVSDTNRTHTTCMCNHLANMAILMEETTIAAPHTTEGIAPHIATIIAAIVSILALVCITVIGFFTLRRLNLKPNLYKFISSGHIPCLKCSDSETDKNNGMYPNINSSPTSTTLSSGTPTTQTTMSSNYFLNTDCQIQQPVITSPKGQNTIYRTRLANGQFAHVIPISHLNVQDPNNTFFRPVSPFGHIYMEIDPVYAGIENSETQSDIQLSDLSDDDMRRCSDVSRQSSNRYAEERPLIRNTLRKSAPHQRQCQTNMRQPLNTVSASCSSSLRGAIKHRQPVFGGNGLNLDTPITIALTPGGDQFVSLQLDGKTAHAPQQQLGAPHQAGHRHNNMIFSDI